MNTEKNAHGFRVTVPPNADAPKVARFVMYRVFEAKSNMGSLLNGSDGNTAWIRGNTPHDFQISYQLQLQVGEYVRQLSDDVRRELNNNEAPDIQLRWELIS